MKFNPNDELHDYIRIKSYLLNLLAVIHRDGGHFTERHGIGESTEVAMSEVNKLRLKSEN